MSERARSVKDLRLDQLPIERAWGVRWDVESDTFGIEMSVKDKPPARRGILSVVSSVYDQLGFEAPFTLPAKTLLQDPCCQNWSGMILYQLRTSLAGGTSLISCLGSKASMSNAVLSQTTSGRLAPLNCTISQMPPSVHMALSPTSASPILKVTSTVPSSLANSAYLS